VKKKAIPLGIICICGLFLAACASPEETSEPTITSKPKVLIVDAATPTPTLTLEEGELPTPTEGISITETPESVPEEPVTPEPTPSPELTATPKPTPSPEPTKEVTRSYEKGALTAGEFKSEWMGLKFTSEKGMELSSQKELDDIMRLTEEAVSEKEIDGPLNYKDLSLVYEMSLVWQDKGLTMQVMVEKMADGAATEQDYVAALRDELVLLEESGFTYIVDDKTYSETIGGKEFSNFGYTTYFGSDVSLHQENYIRKQGDRMILISIMGETEEGMQELVEQFKSY